jgi:hypothetical protein
MKKQIIAAAVAATVSSVALADISITGTTKVNYNYEDFDNGTTANTAVTEHNLTLTGKNGDTTVVMNVEADNRGDSGLDLEDVYLATKVGDIALKVGEWDNGNNHLRGSSSGSNKIEAKTSIQGIDVTWGSGHGDGTNDEVTVGTTISGVGVKYKEKSGGHDISVATNVAGFDVNYFTMESDTAGMGRSSIEVGTTIGDYKVKVAKAEAERLDTLNGDSWLGDFEDETGATNARVLEAGMDAVGVSIATSVAGNAVEFRHTSVDKDTSNSKDRTFNKLIVTRPLASGATFEMTYTAEEEADTAANTSNAIDLELSVAF